MGGFMDGVRKGTRDVKEATNTIGDVARGAMDTAKTVRSFFGR
jgi:hypothetical protein